MPSKKELRAQLDQLLPDTPINIDPKLARMHHEFHLAGKIDETVPHGYAGTDDVERMLADLKEMKPTHLQTALEIWDDLMYQVTTNLGAGWDEPVLKLLGIILNHNPPSKIKHKI